MTPEELEREIHVIVSKIHCPGCDDTFTLAPPPSKRNEERESDESPVEEKVICRKFREELDRQTESVRIGRIPLSDFRMWARQYSIT